jgi:hypothetical protein
LATAVFAAAGYYQAAVKFSSRPHADLWRHACLYVGLIGSSDWKWEDGNEFCQKAYIIASQYFDSKMNEIFESERFQRFPDQTLIPEKQNEI